jgi:hypothetical protein
VQSEFLSRNVNWTEKSLGHSWWAALGDAVLLHPNRPSERGTFDSARKRAMLPRFVVHDVPRQTAA